MAPGDDEACAESFTDPTRADTQLGAGAAASSSVPEGAFPAVASEVRRWVVDTGSGHDLIQLRDVADMGRHSIPASVTLRLNTANGQVKADRIVPLRVRELGETISPYVLPSTPPVLSVGRRCMDEGYTFEWKPYSSTPTLRSPGGETIELRVDGYVPYIQSGAPAVPAAATSSTSSASSSSSPASGGGGL